MSKNQMEIIMQIDEDILKRYYPTETYTDAYDDIEGFMKENGFVKLNYTKSVYLSSEPVGISKVEDVISRIVKTYPWLNKCVYNCEAFEVSNIVHLDSNGSITKHGL